MIRDTIQIIWLSVFGFLLFVFCFFAGLSNFKATNSQQMLTEVVGAVLMKDRDDAARVQRETFFLQKDKFEKHVIAEFMHTNNVKDTTTVAFRFTYDDGEYAPLQPENKRSVEMLRNRQRETIHYTYKGAGNLADVANYQISDVTYETFETTTVDGHDKTVAKVTKKEPRNIELYNRSVKQVTVLAVLNGEKEYQATYTLDTRGPINE